MIYFRIVITIVLFINALIGIIDIFNYIETTKDFPIVAIVFNWSLIFAGASVLQTNPQKYKATIAMTGIGCILVLMICLLVYFVNTYKNDDN